MPSYTQTIRVPAPRETVFEVVADRCGYADISMLRSVVLLTPGLDGAQGSGAVHKMAMVGSLGPREQITELVPPERMVYKVIGGMPVREHVGTIDLADNGDGTTTFTYTMESTALFPAPAYLHERILKFSIRTLAEPIAAEAARRAGTAPPHAGARENGHPATRIIGLLALARVLLAFGQLRASRRASRGRRGATAQLALGVGALTAGRQNPRMWAGAGALADSRRLVSSVRAARNGRRRAVPALVAIACAVAVQVWALLSPGSGADERKPTS